MFFETARNLGIKIFPSIKCKIAKACYKAWKKRALALNKNLFSRNPCSGSCWIPCQTDSRNLNGILSPIKEQKKMEEEKTFGVIFAVRTTAGQEKNVATLIAARAEMGKLPIKAVLVPEMLKGYVFIEADGPHFVEEAIAGIKHVRSRVPGIVDFSEVERYIVVKPVIEELDEEDTVEVVGGPFKGMKARITRVDRTKEEVTLELLEATFTMPITVHADYVKLVEKGKKE